MKCQKAWEQGAACRQRQGITCITPFSIYRCRVARTGAAAGHSGESGRERHHAPFGGSPLVGTTPLLVFTDAGVMHVHAIIPCHCLHAAPCFNVLALQSIHCTCFSTFWHCHPYILQHFNGIVFTPLYTYKAKLLRNLKKHSSIVKNVHL